MTDLSAHPRVVVVMAAYNEARNIAPVIRRIRAQGCRCVVADDGSSDGTAAVAREAGASVVQHRVNLGQAAGLVTGFKAALLEPSDAIIEMDADGQHEPADIPRFLRALEQSGADVVVGSRVLGSTHANAPFLRRAFLPHYTSLINALTGYRMTDAMCGYRAFRTASLRASAELLDRLVEPQYFAAELFLRMAREGLTVSEIPVHLRDRTSGLSTKGTLRYGLGVLKAIWRSHER
jgi:glycosyltransferase involved in cell wall biosynthesis